MPLTSSLKMMSSICGIVGTNRELRAGLGNDLRLAKHEFGEAVMVAAIECGQPFAHSYAAQRDLRMQMFAHALARVDSDLLKAQGRALDAARHDADVF